MNILLFVICTLESGIDVGQGITVGPGKCVKKNKRRAFNKAVGPGKNPKLINVGLTFIPDYRVRVCTYNACYLQSEPSKLKHCKLGVSSFWM